MSRLPIQTRHILSVIRETLHPFTGNTILELKKKPHHMKLYELEIHTFSHNHTFHLILTFIAWTKVICHAPNKGAEASIIVED